MELMHWNIDTTVGEMWGEFEEVVLPSDAPYVQRREMRRSFYAGAKSLLMWQVEQAETVSEDDMSDALDRIDEELNQFAESVREELN